MVYHHGLPITKDNTEPQSVVEAEMDTVGMVGTAPDADNAVFPMNEPVHLFGYESDKIAALGSLGNSELRRNVEAIAKQGVNAEMIVVRAEKGTTAEATMTNVIGSSGEQSGLYALLYSQNEYGRTPNIILASEHTAHMPDGNANPVIAEMIGIADQLEALIVANGPNIDREAAVEHRRHFNSDRLLLVDPYVKVQREGVTMIEPAAPYVAGIGCRVDAEKDGPFHSWSNRTIQGITGIARKTRYFLSDPDSEVNYLNSQQVASIFRERGDTTGGQGGYTFWGNETATDDAVWRFYNVRRGRDFIHRSLRSALKDFIGRENIEPHAVTAIYHTIEKFLGNLKARNKIIGYSVSFDPAKNDALQLRAGKISIQMNAEEAPPIQTLKIDSGRYLAAWDEFVADILRATTSNA